VQQSLTRNEGETLKYQSHNVNIVNIWTRHDIANINKCFHKKLTWQKKARTPGSAKRGSTEGVLHKWIVRVGLNAGIHAESSLGYHVHRVGLEKATSNTKMLTYTTTKTENCPFVKMNNTLWLTLFLLWYASSVICIKY